MERQKEREMFSGGAVLMSSGQRGLRPWVSSGHKGPPHASPPASTRGQRFPVNPHPLKPSLRWDRTRADLGLANKNRISRIVQREVVAQI